MKIEMYRCDIRVASEVIKLPFMSNFEKRVEEHEAIVKNTMKAMEAVHGEADYFVLTGQSCINEIKYEQVKRKLYDLPNELPVVFPEPKPIVRPAAIYSNKQFNQAS